MRFRETVMRRLALTDQGYGNLKRGTVAVMLHDFVQMLPVAVVFLLVCDVMDFGAFDFDLSPWIYVAACLAIAVLMYVTYQNQYNRTYFDTYSESADIRLSMAEKLRKLPLSYFGRKDPTDLTMCIMNDVAVHETAMSTWVPQLIGSMLFTAVSAVIILIWFPMMGLASMWPVPLAFAIVLLSGKVQDRCVREKSLKTMAVNESVQEYLETNRDLKANNAGDLYLDRMSDMMDDAEKAQFRSEYTVAAFVTSAQILLKFGLVSTLAVGAYLLVDGTLDFFVFLAFMITVGRMYDPLAGSLGHLAGIIQAGYNFGRMQEIYDEVPQEGSTDFSPDGYDIVFDHVGFSYEGGRDVLQDVSFTARQGEVTALVGPSGGGKSTVAKLASRFWDVDKGSITLGGVDISTVDPETLLSSFSIVFQDVVLFNSSVMENIRIGRKGATDEEVIEAAEAAMCGGFVSELPDGYGTVIGENGAMLSGGERQRISIARALLKDASVVIMDEATASLDTECETQVQQAISRLVRDKTVLIVAHRMRTVEDADRIVVLRDGTVEEQGSPEELMCSRGTFSRMVSLQNDSSGWTL